MSLLEYNDNLNNIQGEEIYKGEILMKNLNNQSIILKKLNEKYILLEKEEKKLQAEIFEQQQKLNKFLLKTKKIQLNQTTLKEQNMKLLKEKNNYFVKHKNNSCSLELLKKKLFDAKSEYSYNKIKKEKSTEKYLNAKKRREKF